MLFDKLFGHASVSRRAGAGDGLNIAEMRWHHLARPPEHGITTWGGVCSGGKAEVHVDYGQYRSRDPPRVYSAKVAGRDVQSEVEERRAAGGGGEKEGWAPSGWERLFRLVQVHVRQGRCRFGGRGSSPLSQPEGGLATAGSGELGRSGDLRTSGLSLGSVRSLRRVAVLRLSLRLAPDRLVRRIALPVTSVGGSCDRRPCAHCRARVGALLP